MENKRYATLTEEKLKLATENHNLIYSFLNSNHLSDDWYGAAAVGYMKAVHRYDKSVGAFSTLAYIAMRGECIVEINRNKRSASNDTVSIDEIVPGTDGLTLADMIEDPDFAIPFDHAESKLIFARFISRLTAEENKIVHLRLRGESVLHISKLLKSSQPRIRHILKDKIRLKFDSTFHPKTR